MFIVYEFISIMAVRHARDTVKNMCTTEQGFYILYGIRCSFAFHQPGEIQAIPSTLLTYFVLACYRRTEGMEHTLVHYTTRERRNSDARVNVSPHPNKDATK